jgi:hypothetical protein
MTAAKLERTRLRAWTLRSVVALGLVGAILVPMATLAVASTREGPNSAIPVSTLDRLLHPAVPLDGRSQHCIAATHTRGV